jgi:hypothetical protein
MGHYFSQLVLVLYTAIGVAAHEFFRRTPRFSLGVFVLAPLILIPFWFLYSESQTWFHWVKICSVLICIYLIQIVKLYPSKWFFRAIYLVLCINISEAAVRSLFVTDSGASTVVALSSLFLILGLPSWRSMTVDQKNHRDFLYCTSYPLIFLYSFWNWTFIYTTFPQFSGAGTAILLAPLCATFFLGKSIYLQARVYTLAIYMIADSTSPFFLNAVLLPDQTNPFFAWSCALISLVWAVGYFVKTRRSVTPISKK